MMDWIDTLPLEQFVAIAVGLTVFFFAAGLAVKRWSLLDTERFRRRFCAAAGHDWIHDERGAPVIPCFAVCRRCGKYTRLNFGGG